MKFFCKPYSNQGLCKKNRKARNKKKRLAANSSFKENRLKATMHAMLLLIQLINLNKAGKNTRNKEA